MDAVGITVGPLGNPWFTERDADKISRRDSDGRAPRGACWDCGSIEIWWMVHESF